MSVNDSVKMVSYWREAKDIYVDGDMRLITGYYDHKNEDNGGYKALGIHWGSYPKSHNVLSPCVIPKITRNAILSGLLHQAVIDGNTKQVEEITNAIKFFKK